MIEYDQFPTYTWIDALNNQLGGSIPSPRHQSCLFRPLSFFHPTHRLFLWLFHLVVILISTSGNPFCSDPLFHSTSPLVVSTLTLHFQRSTSTLCLFPCSICCWIRGSSSIGFLAQARRRINMFVARPACGHFLHDMEGMSASESVVPGVEVGRCRCT